jgi:hypothetical protein
MHVSTNPVRCRLRLDRVCPAGHHKSRPEAIWSRVIFIPAASANPIKGLSLGNTFNPSSFCPELCFDDQMYGIILIKYGYSN